LVTAVRFLTIVPVPGRGLTGNGALGRAAVWFPVVGLGLGLALAAADRALGLLFPPLLSALLVLTLWKLLTGGIHLDGLADCLDGLAGTGPAHSLSIMKDSRVGVFGVIGLILFLLLALIALAELPPALRWRALLLAPMAGRFTPVVLASFHAAATPERGYGSEFIRSVKLSAVALNSAVVPAAAGFILWPWGLAAVAIGLAAAWLWAAFLSKRLEGLTGDVLGAGVELAELAVLLTGVALATLALA
jgi:adenosylcobinamide-GDP ribazoletransferase